MKHIAYTLLIAALGLTAASCDNHDEPAEWQPAPATDAPGIYFTATDNLLTVTVGEDTHVSIPVRRLSAASELTVPLVVEAGHPDLVVPESLTFAAGEQDAQIVVDLAAIPTKELISLNITFPDEYINPYAAGSPVFDGSVLVSDWTQITDSPLQLQWLDWDYNPSPVFDTMENVVMHLPGTNRYRIINFLYTGVDFTFDLQPSAYYGWDGYYRIIPLGNQVLWSAYEWSGYYNPWWLVEDDLENWPVAELTTGGQPKEVYGNSFMWYDDEYGNEYCYARLAGTKDASGKVAETTRFYFSYYGFFSDSWDWDTNTGYLHIYFELPAE